MNAVARALARALKSFLHPQLLLISVLPTLAAALLWASLAILYWAPLNAALTDWLRHTAIVDWILYAARVLFRSDAAGFLPGISKLLIFFTVWPLIQATALLLTAVLAMPLMVSQVARRNYPALEKRQGGTFLRSAANGALGSVLFMFLWLLTLPLWLVPGVVLVLPLVLSAYLNQRMFCYDALAAHADAEELHALTHGHRFGRYVLGGILGVLHYVPVLGWFAPVFIGLAYIHWGLGNLTSMRAGLQSDPAA